jgi:hypothetical protein
MTGGVAYIKMEPNKDFVLPELAADPEDEIRPPVEDRRPGGGSNEENST